MKPEFSRAESAPGGAGALPSTGGLAQRLGLWDAVSIPVGIMVGTAIFRSPPLVFQNVAGPWQALGVWLLGGVLCVLGALCYAELATTYPRNGGDYEYLSRAYGRGLGFLFGWSQLAVVLTSSIGAMAYALADYAARLWTLPPEATAWTAATAVIMLTAMNLLGVVVGKSLQNVLTGAKILGLGGVAMAGVFFGRSESFHMTTSASPMTGPGLGLALVFVLYAYGGWSDAVFVTAEVREPRRNMPRALLLSVAAVTLIYLAVNAAYVGVLGFDAARTTPTPAADVLGRALGPVGIKTISILVMISALGAINGMILAGSRVYATLGEDHRAFYWLARWRSQAAVPVAALLTQGGIVLLMIFAVGTSWGRGVTDYLLACIHLPAMPWDNYLGGFEALVAGSAPVFWAFACLTGVSLFVLRVKDGRRERPFRVPWFPLPPLVFCGTCLYMLYSSVAYAKSLALLGVAAVVIGLPLCLMNRRSS